MWGPPNGDGSSCFFHSVVTALVAPEGLRDLVENWVQEKEVLVPRCVSPLKVAAHLRHHLEGLTNTFHLDELLHLIISLLAMAQVSASSEIETLVQRYAITLERLKNVQADVESVPVAVELLESLSRTRDLIEESLQGDPDPRDQALKQLLVLCGGINSLRLKLGQKLRLVDRDKQAMPVLRDLLHLRARIEAVMGRLSGVVDERPTRSTEQLLSETTSQLVSAIQRIVEVQERQDSELNLFLELAQEFMAGSPETPRSEEAMEVLREARAAFDGDLVARAGSRAWRSRVLGSTPLAQGQQDAVELLQMLSSMSGSRGVFKELHVRLSVPDPWSVAQERGVTTEMLHRVARANAKLQVQGLPFLVSRSTQADTKDVATLIESGVPDVATAYPEHNLEEPENKIVSSAIALREGCQHLIFSTCRPAAVYRKRLSYGGYDGAGRCLLLVRRPRSVFLVSKRGDQASKGTNLATMIYELQSVVCWFGRSSDFGSSGHYVSFYRRRGHWYFHDDLRGSIKLKGTPAETSIDPAAYGVIFLYKLLVERA